MVETTKKSFLNLKKYKNYCMNSFFLMVCALTFVGCSGMHSDAIVNAIKSGATFQRSKVWLERVRFHPMPGMNNNSPVTVNVVVVYDKDLLKTLVKMDAKKYFKSVDQLKIDNSGKMDVFSFDVIKDTPQTDNTIEPTKMSGEGAIIFARYASPGPHRAVVDDQTALVIALDKDDFSIKPLQE